MLLISLPITTTLFICHNLAISSFNKRYFLIFFCSLSHTLVSLLYNQCLFLYFINYHSIWSSGFYHVSHCMVKSHRILNFLFSTMLSGSCSYQSLALLNPILHCHASVCTPFGQVCHNVLIIWDIVSFLVPYIVQRSDSGVLSILYLI